MRFPLTPIYSHVIPKYPILNHVIFSWVRPQNAVVGAILRREAGMTMFMSTITGKIDAKGRVSVPSVFRSAISAQNGQSGSPQGIFVYPSFTENAIEGGGHALMNDIGKMVERLDLYTEERDALAASLFADSYHLNFDADGRVSLPAALLAHAGIEKELSFVGLGGKFQIWNPQSFSDFRAKSRAMALEKRGLLRSLSHAPPGGTDGSQQ
jgi:MraZ protein